MTIMSISSQGMNEGPVEQRIRVEAGGSVCHCECDSPMAAVINLDRWKGEVNQYEVS